MLKYDYLKFSSDKSIFALNTESYFVSFLGLELCSLSTPDGLISSLPEEKYIPFNNDDEGEIDIIDIVEDEPSSSSVSMVQEGACYLPHLSDSSMFIKQTASQVNLNVSLFKRN